MLIMYITNSPMMMVKAKLDITALHGFARNFIRVTHVKHEAHKSSGTSCYTSFYYEVGGVFRFCFVAFWAPF